MAYNTNNPVGSTDPRDLYDNAGNLDKLVNGADPFYADRLGKLRESWAGMQNTFDTSQAGRESAFTLSQADKENRFQAFLVSSGYVSKGDYAANVVLAERNEYVAVNAATTGTSPGLYRPNASATLPLTLTGTWATDSANLVLLGDDVLRQDLADDTVPALGAGMVGRSSQVVGSIAGLRLLDKTAASAHAFVSGYYAHGDGGGGAYYLDSADTTSTDNGGTTIVAADGARWKLATTTALTPLQFGAVADGVTNDRAAITAMLSTVAGGQRNFDFLGLTYFLGIINVPDGAIFQFTQIHGLRLLGMPKMLVTNQMVGDLAYQSVFEFVDCSDLEVECDAEGDAFNPVSPNSNGVVAVQLRNDLVSAKGVRVKAKVTKGLAAFQTGNTWTARTPDRPIYSDIDFDLSAEDAEYGTRLINCGFNVTGRIRTKLVARSYFPVGVHNHVVVIDSEQQRNFMDVLIKAYEDSVSNIDVTLNQRSSTNAEWPVCIEHQNDGELTSIRGVSVHLNMTGRTTPKAGTTEIFCVGRALTLAGAARTSTNCVTDNISLTLNGIQEITSTATLALPTKANVSSRIECNFNGVLGLGSAGYTIVQGDGLRGSTQGAPNTNPVRIKLGSIYPAGGYFLATLHGNKNVSDTDCTNALTRIDLVRVAMDTAGAGVAQNTIISSDSRGTGFDFAYSLAGGVLSVTSTVTDATAIMAVTLTPLGGRFL